MSRLLIVHSDAEARRELRESLARDGHTILEAADGVAALAWVRSGPVDLVLADVRLRDPDAPSVRLAIRRGAAQARLPFVFLASGPGDGALLARVADEDLVLLRRPFDGARVSRLAAALLAGAPRQDGGFADSSFDALLLQVEANHLSGVLSAFRGETAKKLVFRDGEMIFAGSNDPRELIGHAFVSAGLIEEAELKEAMVRQQADREPLAKVLQKIAKITPAQADETVRMKFEECALDLYLWREGSWSFTAGIPDVPANQSLAIGLAHLRSEAARRIPRWKAMRQMLPSDEVSFVVDDAMLALKPTTQADRKLVALAAKRAPIAQIKLEVRGTDYSVYARLTELVRSGVLAPSNALPAPSDEELEAAGRALVFKAAATAATRAADAAIEGESDLAAAAQEKVERAESALAADDAGEARRLFREVLALDPANPYARRGLAEIDLQREKRIRDLGITPARTVHPRLRDEEVATRALRPSAAFVLSRIDKWGTKIADLLVVTPLPEIEVLEIIEELSASGIVALT